MGNHGAQNFGYEQAFVSVIDSNLFLVSSLSKYTRTAGHSTDLVMPAPPVAVSSFAKGPSIS